MWIKGLERVGLPRVLAGMAGFFTCVHALLLWRGFQFETYPLDSFLHFLDAGLLKTRLLESCFYLHIQPPLFNFLIGLVLKCAPQSYTPAFHAIYLLIGLCLYLAVFLLFVRLGLSRALALVLSTLFMLSPSFLLFEHWLFYTLPCTMLLILSAVFFHDAAETGGRLSIAGFFVSTFLLCTMWGLFHISYFVVVSGALLVACARQRKRVIMIGLLPFLILLGLYTKNYALFGNFGMSTLVGRNLWINTVGSMNWPDRQRLAAEGKISKISLIARWNSLEYYPPEYLEAEGFDNVPALRQIAKSTGAHNFNHLAHVAISNQYMADAVQGLRHQPKAFILALAVSWYNYFRPAANYHCSVDNARILAAPMFVSAYFVYGRLPFDISAYSHLADVTNSPPHLFLIAGLPLLLLYGTWLLLAGKDVSKPQRWLLLFMCFNIVFVALIGTTFDYGETNRYRFSTDPFYLAFFGLLLQNRVIPFLMGRLTKLNPRTSADGSNHGGHRQCQQTLDPE